MDKINDGTRVTLRSVVEFPLYMRAQTYNGDICIPAGAKKWRGMTAEELHMQVLRDNKIFTGTDGLGKNARVVIEDDDVRAYVFDMEKDESGKLPTQTVFDREAAQKLFTVTPKSAFVEAMHEIVKTDSDKKMLVEYARGNAGELRKYQIDAIAEYADAVIK